MLPAINTGQVELLHLHDLRQELIGLERMRGRSGRDRVVHPLSRHDDLANAVGGLVQMLAVRRRKMFEKDGSQSPEEQKPKPYVPGRGVVTASTTPLYWVHPGHLVPEQLVCAAVLVGNDPEFFPVGEPYRSP
jgi:hypothetical protein